MPSRRTFVQTLAAAPALAAAPNRPNILYLHSHDTGRYLQPYGHAVPAPNLQKLASAGVLFRQAFSAAPTCSPSRAALLTGQCSHSSGMYGLAHRGFSLHDYQQHILHTLRPAGYRSGLTGVQHIARDPAVIGFDDIVKTQTTRAEHVAPAAVEYLNRVSKTQPFWLEVGFFETHREFPKPGPLEDPRTCQPPAPIPDTDRTRYDMACYHASARLLDQGVGEVLRALEANGLAGNTLVIYTTDHGIAFPAMKCNLTDHGIGVSLIMRGPGFAGGGVVDGMVSHTDLFPTVCEMLDIARPAWLQGASLLPLIHGEKSEIHDEVFAEVSYHAAYEPKRAVRTKRWKYIRNYDERRKPVLPNCDDGSSKTVWLQAGWRDRPIEREQLYDLTFDPNETRNAASDPASASVLDDLRGRLDRWMKRTIDPLLNGSVPAPAGAMVNDPEGVSPQEQPQPAK